MNSFYNEFTIGFNWYYIVAPLLLVGIAYLATKQYSLKTIRLKGCYKRRYEISSPKFNKEVFRLYAIVAAVIIMVMVYVESIDGIIQWHDNRALPGIDPVISVVMATIDVGIIVPLCYGLITFGVGRLASWVWLGYLTEQKSQKMLKLSDRSIAPRA